jgi:predicted membrane protein
MRPGSCNGRYRQQHRIVFGLFFILAGILALLSNLHLVDIGEIRHYWPTIFCVFGVLKIAHARRLPNVVFGLGLIVLGVGLTLQNLGLMQHVTLLTLPILLILAGVLVLSRAIVPHRGRVFGREESAMSSDQDGVVNMNVTMSGAVLRSDSQDFKGGELRAFMGAIELDLRHASMSSPAVLQVFAVCGGIQIRIPSDWLLRVQVAPVLGGVEDKTIPPVSANKTLVLKGEIIMGGIQIKN